MSQALASRLGSPLRSSRKPGVISPVIWLPGRLDPPFFYRATDVATAGAAATAAPAWGALRPVSSVQIPWLITGASSDGTMLGHVGQSAKEQGGNPTSEVTYRADLTQSGALK